MEELHCGYTDRCAVAEVVNIAKAKLITANFIFLGCGRGVERRHVFCRDIHGNYTSDDFCLQARSKPETEQPCDVTCAVDCAVETWGAWSRCSAECGAGGDAMLLAMYMYHCVTLLQA